MESVNFPFGSISEAPSIKKGFGESPYLEIFGGLVGL
jgi:hypothetical protein